MNAEIIGYFAAFLTTVAYIPQTVKVLRSKSTQSLSLGMFSLIFCGITLWLVYGFLISDWPLIWANGITLVLAGTILWMKIRHG